MLKLKLFIGITLFAGMSHFAAAQSLNWKNMQEVKHVANAHFGLDYGITYGIGFSYILPTKRPWALSFGLSLPVGEERVDDLKTKIGAQFCVLKTDLFMVNASFMGVYRRFENDQVRLQNFGSDLKLAGGIAKSKWFLLAEIGFDKAIVTHFKHSDAYKQEIYAMVVDGWYEPATGGNFYYGLQSGYSMTKADITLNIGKVISQDFKTAPFLPFYLNLGYNLKF